MAVTSRSRRRPSGSAGPEELGPGEALFRARAGGSPIIIILRSYHYLHSLNYVNDPEDASQPRRQRLTRAESKAQTRQRLLEAAEIVFARKGFTAASVEEIAETAGYSIGALYANFESKEQLFVELISTRRAHRSAVVVETFDDAVADNVDPLEALGRFCAELADKNTESAALQTEFWLYAVRNPPVLEAFAAVVGEQIDQLEGLVAREFDRLDSKGASDSGAVTVVIFALVQGLMQHRRIDPARVPDELFAQALRWLFSGVRSELNIQVRADTNMATRRRTLPPVP
jgi:AcrR family transcriptional regulator